MLKIGRIYDLEEYQNDICILVDRLWPRGKKKSDLEGVTWIKEIAPSTDVRKQYHNDHDYTAFQKAYRNELDQNEEVKDMIAQLKEQAEHHTVVLLTASKDFAHSNASVLCQYLKKEWK